MKAHVLCAVCVSAALAAGACKPELTEGGFVDQEIDAGVEQNQDAGRVEADFTDMTGTWALVADFSTCVTLFKTEEVRNRTVSKVTITQERLSLTEIHEDCESGNTPVANLEAQVPLMTVQTANPMEVSSVLFGTEVGSTYRSQLKVRTWGIDMDDPIGDSFPRAADLPDERIFDADEDGNPGVTLIIGDDFCRVFIVQRALESISGTLMDDGSIQGGGSLATVQTFLGATNDFCSSEYDIVGNDTFSAFRMVRVDERGLDFDEDGDGEVSCDEILARRESILVYESPDESRCDDP